MLANLYRDDAPPPTPHESAILPLARQVQDEWVQTIFRGPTDLDNLTQEDWKKRDAYRSLMLKEPAVATPFWLRLSSLMTLQPKMLPADPDNPRSVSLANFVKYAIGCVDGGWPFLLGSIGAGGLLDGFSVCELVFDFPERGPWKGKRWVLREAAPLDGRFLRFDVDHFKRVRGVRGLKANAGKVFDADRFAIYSHQQLFNNPFGISQFRSAYRAAVMLESAIKLRIILLQNYSGPFLAFKSGAQTTREQAMRIVAHARSLGYIVCDPADEIQVLNMAAGTDAQFQSCLDDLRKEMYTAIAGASLPFMEGRSGAEVGNSEVQKSVTQALDSLFAVGVATTINRHIIPSLVRANIDDDSLDFPTLQLGDQSPKETKAAGDNFEQAKRIGVPLSKKQIQRTLGLEEPSGPDDELAEPEVSGSPAFDGAAPGTSRNPLAGHLGLMGGSEPTGPAKADGPDEPEKPPDAGQPSPLPPNPGVGPAPGYASPPAGAAAHGYDFSHIEPRIGRVSTLDMDKAVLVAALDLQAKAVSLGRPGQYQRAVDALRGMIGRHPMIRAALHAGQPAAPPPPTHAFGWQRDESRTGHVKAVGYGDQYGQVLYGAEAESALTAQDRHAAPQGHPTNQNPNVPAHANASPSGLTRDFKAGMKQAGITFVNENQRDLYDLGAKIRAGMKSGRRVDTSALEQSLATRLGMDPSEVYAKAMDVHKDLKNQMSGVKDGETRTVRDNHDTAGYQSLGKQIGQLSLDELHKARESLAPTPAVEAMADRLTEHVLTLDRRFAGAATRVLKDRLDESTDITADQWAGYHGAVERATYRMPRVVQDTIAKHLAGATFHADPSDIGDGLHADVMSLASTPEQAVRYAERFAGLAGKKLGAAYCPTKGTIHIDGDVENVKGRDGKYGHEGAIPAHEVYAHVLGHVLDGPEFALSSTEAWKTAHAREFGKGRDGEYRLTAMAASSPEEGLAEFSRLVFATDVNQREIAKAFPLASAIFRQQGFWPGSDQKAEPGAQLQRRFATPEGRNQHFRLRELFSERVEVAPDRSHVDVLAPVAMATDSATGRQTETAKNAGKTTDSGEGVATGFGNLPATAPSAVAGTRDDEPASVRPARSDPNPGETIPPVSGTTPTGRFDDQAPNRPVLAPEERGDADDSDLPDRASRLSEKDDPFAMPDKNRDTSVPKSVPPELIDDEFPDAPAQVTGADLLGRLNAIGDDGKKLVASKPKLAGGDSLHQIVTKSGGIDPTSPDFLKHFEGVNEAVEYGIPRTVFKIGGRDPQEMAKELHNEGHIHIEGQSDDAPDVDGTDHLFQQLATGAKSLHSQGDRADRAADENARREQEEAEAGAPWKLTKGEFLKQHADHEAYVNGGGMFDDPAEIAAEANWRFPAAHAVKASGGGSPEDAHRRSVETALREGRSVAANVLKDYPDLAPVKAAVATTATLRVGSPTQRAKGEPGDQPTEIAEGRPKAEGEAPASKTKVVRFNPTAGQRSTEPKADELTTESAESVLNRIRSSPNQPDDRDWSAYAEEHGVTGDFTHAEVPTAQLSSELESGRLVPGNAINPETVAEKVASGDRNPVVIASQGDGTAKVLDGNHSLRAAVEGGDESVAVISNHAPHIGGQPASQAVATRTEVDDPPSSPESPKGSMRPDQLRQALASHPGMHIIHRAGDDGYETYGPDGKFIKSGIPVSNLERELQGHLKQGHRVAVVEPRFVNSSGTPNGSSVGSDPYATDDHETRVERWQTLGHDDEYAETLAKTPWNALSEKQRSEYRTAGEKANDQPTPEPVPAPEPNDQDDEFGRAIAFDEAFARDEARKPVPPSEQDLEREAAAVDKRDRMAEWATRDPDNLAAQDALARANARVHWSRNVAGQPIGPNQPTQVVDAARKAGFGDPSAAKPAEGDSSPVDADAAERFGENVSTPPTNTLVQDPTTPETSDGSRLEGPRAASDRGRLQPPERVGGDAPSAPDTVLPGSDARTDGDERLGTLSPGDDGPLVRRVFGADRPGDPAGDGPRIGPEQLAADPAGRNRPARGVGSGSRRVRASGHNPAIADQSPAEVSLARPSTPENPTGAGVANFRYTDSAFASGGLKAKFAANIAAIRTLQTIRAENRDHATPEEQQLLSRYVGWGQFPAVFNPADGTWAKERETLRGLLTPEEWDGARRSTLNAHYTHPDIVKAHWRMAERLGFAGGRYLETSAGIGYYLGLMPEHLAGATRTTAVELDPTTGTMLKHLYPEANVQVRGFQEHKLRNFYDLVASNVPFGDYRVHDPEYNRHQANIHDYFFLKSADAVRPGGLVMHITSTGTLDKADPRIREELAKTCDLVSAIRFPGGAHKGNAGTDVVTDLLILRKRQPGEAPDDRAWLETTTVPDPAGGEPIPVNRYFAENPDQVLGTLDRTGTMYRGDAVNVTRTPDYEQRLEAAIQRLPAGIHTKAVAPRERFETRPSTPGTTRPGGFAIQDGRLFVQEGGELVPQDVKPERAAKIAAHLQVRDALRAVIDKQLAGEDATEARAHLNRVYDGFVHKHGFLNQQGNRTAFKTDPDAPVLLAAEKWDPKTKTASKADIFHKNTIRSSAKVESVDTPEEALSVTLHETGGVDVARMAKLTGKDAGAIERHLVEKGLAYQDPSHGWQHADQYLSGNVRKKLALARSAAEVDPKYRANVAALEKVQPADVEHGDIEVKLGAAWVPPSDITRFAAELLDGQEEHFAIRYLPNNGQWMADYSTRGKNSSVARGRSSNELWGTDRRNFMDLLEPALNNQTVTVYDKGLDGESVVNREATDAANAKIQDIKDRFREWVWTDDERRERLHRHYNDTFNNTIPMRYNGSHQTFPGMNPDVQLRDHQKNFVWQAVTTGKGLAAHEVGTGKTFTMIAAAMEMRRLGLARKPAIACLKANVEAITHDALRLYPGAKVLSTADMFDAASRKKTIAQIATGDYDLVILTHDHLDLLQMKPDTVKGYIQEELDELEAAKSAAEAEGGNKRGNRVVKALEKAKERLTAKLQEALDATKKDDAVYFEETGVDQLFVDEFHKYKSLPVYTKQDRVKGVPTSRSDRATAMQMRARWLMEQNGGRGVVAATGTPVANTMAELFNMQRYLQPQELKERGTHTFDAWASVYGDLQTKMEHTVTGEYKPVSRFARFVNIPELMQSVRQIMDVQRADHLTNADGSATIQRPKRKDTVVKAPKSPAMEALMANLKKRAEELKGHDPDRKDNMLVICTDGRKGALDMRLVDPHAEDDPDSKVNQAIQNVLAIHKDRPGVTQMIFSDIGVNPAEHGFHLYEDIIRKLEAGGIPRHRIANFAKLDGKAKEAAMQGMREGTILVGIGSTDKMGTGVNAQDKLAALHHLDVPWLPASVEQRDGRGWRQGNQNQQVDIYRYVTEGSLDQTFWQTIGNKTRFIQQVMTPGQSVGRVAKDEDTEELTPDQLMAAASGDPRIMEKVQLDEDLRQLAAAQRRHDTEQARFRDSVARGERNMSILHERARTLRADADHVKAHPDFRFESALGDFSDRKEAGEAFAQLLETTRDPYGYGTYLGKLRGMPIYKVNERVELRPKSGEIHSTGSSLNSAEYVFRNLPKQADDAVDQIERQKAEIEKIRASIGKPFPKLDEMKQKQTRQQELEAHLRGDFFPEGYAEGQDVTLNDGRKVRLVSSLPNKRLKVSDGNSEFHIGHDDLAGRSK